jgi:uncharacterized repeat protein (TIGR01451 family)
MMVLFRLSTILTLLLLPLLVSAAPLLSVSILAEKEVASVIKGEKSSVRIPAAKINPGDVIFYTLNYENSGDEAAQNAVFDDPVPPGTVYLPGSAFGKNSEITFSIDKGATFKKPSLLTYEVRQPNGRIEKRSASPEDYTHIRWTVSTIPARGSGQAGFQVRMK